MATLIAQYNSEGCVGRCDARCHNAKGATCDCICGGKNHGVGGRQATKNTVKLAEELIEAAREAGQEIEIAPIQLELELE